MTGAGGDTGRGVRAAARGLRTWRKLLGMVLAAALVGAASAAAWKASRATTAHQWYAVGMLTLSETLIASGLNPRRPKDVRHPNGRSETVTLGAIARHPPLLALRKRMIDDLLGAADVNADTTPSLRCFHIRFSINGLLEHTVSRFHGGAVLHKHTVSGFDAMRTHPGALLSPPTTPSPLMTGPEGPRPATL